MDTTKHTPALTPLEVELLALLKEAQSHGLRFYAGNCYIRNAFFEKQEEINARIDAAIAKATGSAA